MSEEQEPKDHQENHQNSDHDEGEDNDVMFVEDEIIDQMDEMQYGEEDPNDFETFNEEEFTEGEAYEEG